MELNNNIKRGAVAGVVAGIVWFLVKKFGTGGENSLEETGHASGARKTS
jgi:hypothetical protein